MSTTSGTPTTTQPKAYIPDDGIRFRLQNVQSQQLLFDNPDGRFGVLIGAEYPDQWWTLVKDFGAHPGGYKIKNVKSGRFLFANDKHEIGAFDGDFDDQYFTLVPGRGEHLYQFQIKCYRNDLCIFANSDGRKGAFTCDADNSDQYWTFVYEDMDLVSLNYDLNRAELFGQKPKVLTSVTIPNRTAVPQSSTYEYSESIEHTSTYEWQWGIQIKRGYEFKCALPSAGEIKGSVELSASLGRKWGETNKETRTYKISFPVVCPPGKEVRATATITQATLRVPYVMKLRSKVSGRETESGGIWEGVTSWGLKENLEEFPLAERV